MTTAGTPQDRRQQERSPWRTQDAGEPKGHKSLGVLGHRRPGGLGGSWGLEGCGALERLRGVLGNYGGPEASWGILKDLECSLGL